jgi:hypothetical protein
VFIVTYGRSASTLLMGLINTIPGYNIRGENYNALYGLYQADDSLRRARERFDPYARLTPRHPWYGTSLTNLDAFRQGLVDNFVRNVLRPARGDRVIGFKEIRYTQDHVEDLDGYLTFIREAFPGSKIVFNHRRPEDVARSGWWPTITRALERIRAADERMLAVPADDRHFHFHFDRIDATLDHVRELFDFLGEPLDEKRVRDALANRHSYKKGQVNPNAVKHPLPLRARRKALRTLSRLTFKAGHALISRGQLLQRAESRLEVRPLPIKPVAALAPAAIPAPAAPVLDATSSTSDTEGATRTRP